jgi:mannose-6-phosphate isomerase-like protein (cupin superfamily)
VEQLHAVVRLAEARRVVAPDGSLIDELVVGSRASMVYCTLPAGSVTAAVRHRTVEELWFVVAGAGQLWRHSAAGGSVTELAPGVSVTIETGTAFQFRASDGGDLAILIATIPPWPGADEAKAVEGHWAAG